MVSTQFVRQCQLKKTMSKRNETAKKVLFEFTNVLPNGAPEFLQRCTDSEVRIINQYLIGLLKEEIWKCAQSECNIVNGVKLDGPAKQLVNDTQESVIILPILSDEQRSDLFIFYKVLNIINREVERRGPGTLQQHDLMQDIHCDTPIQ
jgi:hypothetical protein